MIIFVMNLFLFFVFSQMESTKLDELQKKLIAFFKQNTEQE